MRRPQSDAERELLWVLYDLAEQNLNDSRQSNGYEMFSGFIRANAMALRLLEQFGMIETLDPDKGTETPEWTRCVFGHALAVREIVTKWNDVQSGRDGPPDWKKMPEISDEVLQRAHAIMAAHAEQTAAEQTEPKRFDAASSQPAIERAREAIASAKMLGMVLLFGWGLTLLGIALGEIGL